MPGASPTAGARSGVNDSGPQKKVRMPTVSTTGHAGDGALDERPHPVPVGGDLAEREVPRDAVDLPGRGDRLEEADHHAAALLAVVAVGGGVLEDRGVGAHPVDRLGDEVVVLGRLVGHDDAVALGELARPHARRS